MPGRPSSNDSASELCGERADLLGLDGKGLLNGGPQGLHHLCVVEVVHHVLQDVLVGCEPQRTEDDEDGHIRADVGNGCPDGLHTPVSPAGHRNHAVSIVRILT